MQELGNEVYQESLESMQQYHDCKRLKIEGSNGEAVKLRIAANTQDDLRVTQLWYQIKTEVSEQKTGWLSAVYIACLSRPSY